MTLRPLGPADDSLLWRLLSLAVHVPPGAEPPSPEAVRSPPLARYVAGWMREGDGGFAAEVDGAAVGAVWWRLWRGAERGYGWVDAHTPEASMAVERAHRGRGIGTALLRAAAAEATARRGGLSLSVSLSNPARRLYLREGFVPVGELSGGSVTMVRRASVALPPEATRER